MRDQQSLEPVFDRTILATMMYKLVSAVVCVSDLGRNGSLVVLVGCVLVCRVLPYVVGQSSRCDYGRGQSVHCGIDVVVSTRSPMIILSRALWFHFVDHQ